MKGDQVQRIVWQYYAKLCGKYFSHLEGIASDVI